MNTTLCKALVVALSAVLLLFSCTKSPEDPKDPVVETSEYAISLNGQTYANDDVGVASATYTEGTDVNSGKAVYAVVARLEDDVVQITAAPLVVEGQIMPVDENAVDEESSGLLITVNGETYVAISGTMTIKKDRRYEEQNLGSGTKMGKNEIMIAFSGVFSDFHANEIPISGSFSVAR